MSNLRSFPDDAPLRGLEGVPGLPGAPQDEAGLTRKFETSHVGGATGRTPPIPRSALVSTQRVAKEWLFGRGGGI